METWFLILISLCMSVLLKRLILTKKSSQLPPGPFTVPIIGNFLCLLKSFSEVESVLRNLHDKHGPIVTLRVGSRPVISMANRGLAHKALVQNGDIFANRLALPTSKIIASNQQNISNASYGSKWRILRRNLTSEILHPSRVKSYSHARKCVLDILINRLISHINRPVVVIDHFQHAMFCLMVVMCFGAKLHETQIQEIKHVQRRLLLNTQCFSTLNFWPSLGKIIFRKGWEEFHNIIAHRMAVLMPLIEARKRVKQERLINDDDDFVVSYVDTLLDLELTEEKRKLEDTEMISLCSEFLNAGTDTTSTVLQWIMANLVKYPHVQGRLLAEMKGVVVGGEVKEEDLHKLPYLKAVVLEGLRRHPPVHFLVPHAVTEDTVLDGYLMPKNAILNFMVADIGWDPKVWEDPMAFKPERFLSGGGGSWEVVYDISGRREIKMMPFGAGRRICPGFGLAMLHLEYFVANLVWNFEWKPVDGDEVDLSEKQEFTVVMKYPLKAHLSPRF